MAIFASQSQPNPQRLQALSDERRVAGEYHENEVRKDFTASERVAIGKAIEAEIGKRQGRRTDLEPVDGGPQVKGQKTREIAAGKAGFASDRSYRDAAKVVDQGAPELVEAMDAYRPRRTLNASSPSRISATSPARS